MGKGGVCVRKKLRTLACSRRACCRALAAVSAALSWGAEPSPLPFRPAALDAYRHTEDLRCCAGQLRPGAAGARSSVCAAATAAAALLPFRPAAVRSWLEAACMQQQRTIDCNLAAMVRAVALYIHQIDLPGASLSNDHDCSAGWCFLKVYSCYMLQSHDLECLDNQVHANDTHWALQLHSRHPSSMAAAPPEELTVIKVAGAISGVISLRGDGPTVGALRTEAARVCGVDAAAAIKLICSGKTLLVRACVRDRYVGRMVQDLRASLAWFLQGHACASNRMHTRPAPGLDADLQQITPLPNAHALMPFAGRRQAADRVQRGPRLSRPGHQGRGRGGRAQRGGGGGGAAGQAEDRCAVGSAGKLVKLLFSQHL
jgi:hypothetical protein